MAKYVYPAIFAKEDNGQYSVLFPDIENCFTGGDDMAEALEMAEDALCLTLYHMGQEGKPIPEPSDSKSLQVKENETVSLVHCDTIFYKRFYEAKSVKKTLTIPMWLNEAGEKAQVNFSSILQEALKKNLGY
jgi:predicted RNase H-like HicB family nuclease